MDSRKNGNNNVLDDTRIGRLLLKLSLPAFVGIFVITLYNVVDTVFIGRYVGPLGIAGLSIVFPLQMLCMGVGQLVGIGGASLISRMIGAGDEDTAERTLGNSISIIVVLSILITVVGLVWIKMWLRIMGATETIMPYAIDYLRIILPGFMFHIAAMSLNGLIRAEGNAKIPMIGMMVGAISNIILDAVFIIKFGMGIRGAAIATVIAQVMSAVYITSYYFSGNSYLKLRMSHFKFDLKVLGPIFAIGSASFARTLATSLSAVIINNLLSTHGGDVEIAVYGIVNRIVMFALMPGVVIGQGLQPILGFNYGAKRYLMAFRSVKIAIVSSTLLCSVSLVIIHLIPGPIVGIFTTDPDVIRAGIHASRIVFSMMFVVGYIQVGSLYFQSVGKAVESFITAISRTILFLIPLVLILPSYMQLDGIWFAFPITDILTVSLTALLFAPQLKKLKRLGKQQARDADAAR